MVTREAVGAKMVQIAQKYVGVRESPLGSNSGVEVMRFQSATTLAKSDRTGWPWCAAFDASIIQETWRVLNISIPCPWPMTASCDEILYWARAWNRRGTQVLFDTPQKYDIFLSMKSAGDAVHTGPVIEVQSDGDIETIEGNTNNSGSREGIGVFRFIGGNAKHADGRKYVRWLKLLPAMVPTGARPPIIAPARDTTPRLILALPPYQPDDYHALPVATFENGTWSMPGAELAAAVGKERGFPLLKGDNSVRHYLQALKLEIDEKRTRLGNHTKDAADPRQYIFVKSGG